MDETGGFISINKLYEDHIHKTLMSKQIFYNFFNIIVMISNNPKMITGTKDHRILAEIIRIFLVMLL